jgi:hypothetical protein
MAGFLSLLSLSLSAVTSRYLFGMEFAWPLCSGPCITKVHVVRREGQMADATIRQNALDAVEACKAAMQQTFGFRGGFLDVSVLDALFRTGTDDDVKRFTASLRETTNDILKA